MEQQNILAALPGLLLPWYESGHRDLPWRRDREPYHIWLSEIMLQQTRVEAVKRYYTRFLETLPTVRDLAQCDDELLHKLWEGLGYYSRVRNLKKAAIAIIREHDGMFPEEHGQILALPGIGDYTAGAIASIAFNSRTPAVDGNVLRLISRLLDNPSPIDLPATKKAVTAALREIYPDRAGDFTQALMELGATLCGPNRPPECEKCPCRSICLGYRNGTAHTLPVKSPKRAKRTEERTVFILSCNGRYALQKRPETGLLAGLWQFPNTAGALDLPDALRAVEAMGITPVSISRQLERTHIFTHIIWNMRGIFAEVRTMEGDFVWFTRDEINRQAALPTAFRQFWEEVDYV